MLEDKELKLDQYLDNAQDNLRSSEMIVSREKGSIKIIDAVKVSQGSFYTKGEFWLTKPVKDFIAKIIQHTTCVLDPFAGGGDILDALKKHFNIETHGMDINGERWIRNDSLIDIPKFSNYFICTNPPYLAKYSAKRKGVLKVVEKYYRNYDDLYQEALAQCFRAARYTIAIIPETFLNSTFPFQHLKIACVIENNPFGDTDHPVLVACFDTSSYNGDQQANIYIGEEFCFEMHELNKYRYTPSKKLNIIFNDPHGRLAFKAVDGIRPQDRIRFTQATGFHYTREKIKVSSRLLTYIEIPEIADKDLDRLIEIANEKIEDIRSSTKDLILSPFKGNNKEGKRRRRLDYLLARYILESSYLEIYPDKKDLPLFV